MSEVRRVDKPWGYEDIWAESDRYLGKILFIKKGNRLSRQYHEKKDETVYVLKGTLLMELGEGDDIIEYTLKQGEAERIVPGTIHRFCADKEDVTLVEVSSPEINDVVRLEDDYKRK